MPYLDEFSSFDFVFAKIKKAKPGYYSFN